MWWSRFRQKMKLVWQLYQELKAQLGWPSWIAILIIVLTSLLLGLVALSPAIAPFAYSLI